MVRSATFLLVLQGAGDGAADGAAGGRHPLPAAAAAAEAGATLLWGICYSVDGDMRQWQFCTIHVLCLCSRQRLPLSNGDR